MARALGVKFVLYFSSLKPIVWVYCFVFSTGQEDGYIRLYSCKKHMLKKFSILVHWHKNDNILAHALFFLHSNKNKNKKNDGVWLALGECSGLSSGRALEIICNVRDGTGVSCVQDK